MWEKTKKEKSLFDWGPSARTFGKDGRPKFNWITSRRKRDALKSEGMCREKKKNSSAQR